MVKHPVVRQPGELRWETRLLTVVTAVLTVFGIASLYAAAAMEEGSFDLFVKQLAGAGLGAVALLVLSRVDYHRWRNLAWPLLLLALAALVVVVLPFTGSIAPTINRSEEHTSELQSPCNLVCRLLLE